MLIKKLEAAQESEANTDVMLVAARFVRNHRNRRDVFIGGEVHVETRIEVRGPGIG